MECVKELTNMDIMVCCSNFIYNLLALCFSRYVIYRILLAFPDPLAYII